MKITELEKGIEVLHRAATIACEESHMSSGGCQDCPFYNSMAEMPCGLARFGFPLIDELKQYVKESKENLE